MYEKAALFYHIICSIMPTHFGLHLCFVCVGSGGVIKNKINTESMKLGKD